MKKIFWGISAVFGIACALLVHGSFMMVEQVGSYMLPSLEPDQKVLVYLLEKDFKEGDVVAFKPPYYTVGDSNIKLLRISEIENNIFTLTCDAPMTVPETVEVDKEDIIGKAVFYG